MFISFIFISSFQCSFLPKFSIHIETKYEDNKGNNDNVSTALCLMWLEVNRRNTAASENLPCCTLFCLFYRLILVPLVFSPKSEIMNSLCQRVIASLCVKGMRRIISHSAVHIPSVNWVFTQRVIVTLYVFVFAFICILYSLCSYRKVCLFFSWRVYLSLS